MNYSTYFFALFLSMSCVNIQTNDGFFDALEMVNGPRIPQLQRLTSICLKPATKDDINHPEVYEHAQNLLLEFCEKQKRKNTMPVPKRISIAVEDNSEVFIHITYDENNGTWQKLSYGDDENFIEKVTEEFEKLIGNNYKHENIRRIQTHNLDIETSRKRTRE